MDNSSFDNEINNPFVFTDIEPIRSNGATSDTYKVLIYGKWHFLKRPKKIFADNPLYLAAFQKEFEIGYTLDHPNIVRYISKGEDNKGLYILTDYIDGYTLTDFIKIYPDYFNVKGNINKLIKQLLSALGYLHERQILHLDLKPDNILITSINHDVKLIDFGFSYTDCYQSLAIGKTEMYAAPEQSNREKLDQQTDVYGLGKVFEYVLRQSSETKTHSFHKTLINKCLSPNKEDRFKSVNEIQNYLSAKPKSKNIIISFVFIIILLLVGIILNILLSHNEKDDKEQIGIHSERLYTLESHITKSTSKNDSLPQIVSNINEEENREPKLGQTVLLKKEIKQIIASNFKELYEKYEKYDNLNNENYLFAQTDYQNAVNNSLNLPDSLHSKYKYLSKEEISSLVMDELYKKAALYLTWLGKYDQENRYLINEYNEKE